MLQVLPAGQSVSAAQPHVKPFAHTCPRLDVVQSVSAAQPHWLNEHAVPSGLLAQSAITLQPQLPIVQTGPLWAVVHCDEAVQLTHSSRVGSHRGPFALPAQSAAVWHSTQIIVLVLQ
jgi:hypothetical protein